MKWLYDILSIYAWRNTVIVYLHKGKDSECKNYKGKEFETIFNSIDFVTRFLTPKLTPTSYLTLSYFANHNSGFHRTC